MITFLTTAKAFVGDADVRQMNALRSWRKASPDARIMLFGKGDGYEKAARQVGAEIVSDVTCNEHGIPRIDAMFAIGQTRAQGGQVAYVNCDVLLLDDVVCAAQEIPFSRFLMVAQRWNLDVDGTLDLASDAWQDNFRRDVRLRGRLFRLDAIDFFLWQGDVWRDLPPMVVGRGGYDNWLIYSCRKRAIPVVDTTETCMIVHQNHDYGHIEGGRDVVMDGPEARRNVALGGGPNHRFTISDADWQLTKNGIERNRCRGDARRCAEVFAVLHPESKLARSWAGRFFLEARYELAERCDRAGRGDFRPILKFLPWLFCRVFGCR